MRLRELILIDMLLGAVIILIVFLLASCASLEKKADIVSVPVACEECQKFNSDLKNSPDFVKLCICK